MIQKDAMTEEGVGKKEVGTGEIGCTMKWRRWIMSTLEQ
jgi:hypothetical protein